MIKVLAVDDSPTMHRLFKMIFSEDEYQLKLSDNGEDGLELADEMEPDVILLDFIMPKMNGFHFCKALRSNSKLGDVPVLLITSKAEDVGDKFIDKFTNIKCIAKPFQPDELIEKMNEIMEESRVHVEPVATDDQIETPIGDNVSSIETDGVRTDTADSVSAADIVSAVDDVQIDMPTTSETEVSELIEEPAEVQTSSSHTTAINQIISKVEKDILPTLRGTIERFLRFETGYMISDVSGDAITLNRFAELLNGNSGEMIVFNNEKDYHILFENGELFAAWCGDEPLRAIFEMLQDVSGLCLLEVETISELYEQLRVAGFKDSLLRKCYQFYLMSVVSDILEEDSVQFYINEIDISENYRSSLKIDVADVDKFYKEFVEERTEINKILFDDYIVLEKQDVDPKDLKEFENTVLGLCDGQRNLNKILSYFGQNRQFVKNTIGMLILTGYIKTLGGS